MKLKISFMPLALVIGFLIQQPAEAQLVLRQSVLGNGAGDLTSGSNRIVGTVGQPVMGVVSSSSNVMNGGFWYIPPIFPTSGALTDVGTNVVVQPADNTTGSAPVTFAFTNVIQAGATTLSTSGTGPPPPSGFKLGFPPIYYELTTTAAFSGPVEVCIDYSSIGFGNEQNLRLLHRVVIPNTSQEVWVDRTVFLDPGNDIICAVVFSLSLFLIAEAPLEVAIDIKPGSDPNSINCKNMNGTIPVAILTTSTVANEPLDFDATTVDHATVRFGKTDTEAQEIHTDKKSGEPKRHEEDVDGDGDTDLVFHFRFGDTGIECGDTEVTLTGETFNEQAITGTDDIRTVGGTIAKVAVQELPKSYALRGNYPNPFNPITIIKYDLPEPAQVTITIYDLMGRQVRMLVNDSQDAGYKSVIWDGRDESGGSVPSGMYLYRISARSLETYGKFSKSLKMVLLR